MLGKWDRPSIHLLFHNWAIWSRLGKRLNTRLRFETEMEAITTGSGQQ